MTDLCQLLKPLNIQGSIHLLFHSFITAVTCPSLPLPEAVAQIDYDATADASGNLPFGTEATYQCVEVYTRVSGSVVRTCEMNGKSITGVWGEEELLCEGEANHTYKPCFLSTFSKVTTVRITRSICSWYH